MSMLHIYIHIYKERKRERERERERVSSKLRLDRHRVLRCLVNDSFVIVNGLALIILKARN